MKDFHVPLPDETYERLKEAAAESKAPATPLGREAIDFWLRQRLRKARRDAIAALPPRRRATPLDLDKGLRGCRRRGSSQDISSSNATIAAGAVPCV